LDAIHDGGALMVPIGLCSFILFVFVFERAISLRRGRVIPGPFVRLFLQQLRERQLDRQSALELCQQNRSPVAEVFAAAMKKWGRPAVEVEQAIIDEGERVSNGLRRYLRLFNGIATLTPLLGLLGTVFGMISSFNAIATADAMGRPELLAGGISQALITTAAGLTVAIPALTAYLWFVGRVDRLIIDIDALGQQVVECISADAWQEPASRNEKSAGKRSNAA
jgi:biopolymer transport protein ExbB